ncbi:MAG: sigma-70 family RNA polymerase sigma factor [Acidobacteria bacterium]|nr:sigma-70 family RNA polymerase sigma factor [Acidobacteriota bacterium]
MRDQTAERELIERIQAGDQAAVSSLVQVYGPRIHQLALRYVKNWEDAEEVAQDVLLKVSRKISAFRGDSALSSWIYRITFNTAMSRLRAQRTRQKADAAAAAEAESAAVTPHSPDEIPTREPVDWSSMADDDLLRVEMRAKLVEGLKKLPEVYRVPVLLRDIQGLSTEEAAAVLRVKSQTLKSRLHRGRLILRQHLSDFAGGLALHRH